MSALWCRRSTGYWNANELVDQKRYPVNLTVVSGGVARKWADPGAHDIELHELFGLALRHLVAGHEDFDTLSIVIAYDGHLSASGEPADEGLLETISQQRLLISGFIHDYTVESKQHL